MINGHTTPIFVENSHERPCSMTLKANTYDFLTKNGLHHNSKNLIYDIETYVGWGVRASGRWSMATQPLFFVANSHQWTFTIILKVNTYGFLPKKSSPPEIQECDLWQGNICAVRCTSLWSMIDGHTTPIFIENSHEWPFSIILKANTYRFLTKKSSPPKIQECDLRQGNICGMRCTSLWSMINDHTTPIFVENSYERPFSMTLKANTYKFLTKNGLHHNSKNLIYGKETYVVWGVRASGRWSMATQPPFFVANSHQWTFTIIPKVNTYEFLPKKSSPPEIQECDIWQGNICAVRCTSLWSMINGHTTPIFIENSHEWPFSIILKANTYRFLTKKSSPPKIQECDLRQGNICGMRCTSLWSMINDHTTPIFCRK
jgi:hypothetical protein